MKMNENNQGRFVAMLKPFEQMLNKATDQYDKYSGKAVPPAPVAKRHAVDLTQDESNAAKRTRTD